VGDHLSDDEVRLWTRTIMKLLQERLANSWRVGLITLRGYYRCPEYNARAFTSDGFYRSGDLMRLHLQATTWWKVARKISSIGR